MKSVRTVLATALMATFGVAQADELVFHTVSWHTRPAKEYTQTIKHYRADGSVAYETQTRVSKRFNNFNPGIGYRWTNFSSVGLNVGYYHNSYSSPAFYAAVDEAFDEHWGYVAGAATGYREETSSGIMPILAFTYRQPMTNKVSLNFQLVPPIGNHTGVAHATIHQAF